MDAAQTTALRGPRADAAAYLLIRPYLPESVYFAGRATVLADRHAGVRPNWLRLSRGRSRAGPAWATAEGACDDDDPDDHVMQAAQRRKDGNAW